MLAVSLTALALSASVSALVARDVSPIPSVVSNLTSCGAPVLSCERNVTNTCCSPSPGGLQLITQFWDTYTGRESSGQFLPASSWTIHGLWPDNCDGSYNSYCDLSRQYDPAPSPNTTTGKADGTPVPAWTGESIDNVLKRFGRYDLLRYMNAYWVSKHATCTSTFDVSCYGPGYKKGQDVVDFFLAVIRAFKELPTYDILASNGIFPSNSTTYKLADIQAAFLRTTGAVPYLGCTSRNGTVLSEVWYHSHVLGTPQFGTFELRNASLVGAATNCATNGTGIHYYLRSKGSEVSPYA